ncbi:MAG: hypothetical protein B6227_00645, partial [Fusobacteriia bacterium 4572_74]
HSQQEKLRLQVLLQIEQKHRQNQKPSRDFFSFFHNLSHFFIFLSNSTLQKIKDSKYIYIIIYS